MDLLDFDNTELYFDEPLAPEVEQLLQEAGEAYGSEEAEKKLLTAGRIAPQHLVVLVALYRYYFYQHRLEDALLVAESALAVSGRKLGLNANWRYLHLGEIGAAAMRSIGQVRFYLMVLKAAGYIHARLGDADTGRAMLEKLVELDSLDRIGGRALLEVLEQSADDAGTS